MKSNKAFFLVAALALGLTSCSWSWSWNRHQIVQDVTPGSWSAAQPAIVLYENRDTVFEQSLTALVRFRNDFDFDRLDFVLETLTPDSLVWRDTLSVAYPPEAKEKKATSLTYTDAEVVYRTGVVLNRPGLYRFRFTPLMPETPVDAVIGVGIGITTP
ncbi:MAG: gliding motility lipoprotein GldH [Rikenellaceae bacterium]|jgi:hypothetical protein|nr:gliding motility lipoprotein GldH [Rikenellaceae bacterium]